MTHSGAMVMYVLGPPLIALMGLIAQLWCRARRDRQRRDTLYALMSRLPDRGMLEIHEAYDDGIHLCLHITSNREQNMT
jgi:hypothetical protein